MKTPKKTENQIVSDWLIQHRFHNLEPDVKYKLPAFVQDAVYTALYIVAGTSNGKLNASPKAVYKTLMLREITTETVKQVEYGYDMSKRQAQRLAQTTRFALGIIQKSISNYETELTEEQKMNMKLEWKFKKDFYDGKQSSLYSPEIEPVPDEILQLYKDKKYLEYGEAVREFRLNQKRRSI
ncbi:hypothetical protein D3C85_293260 [compost metagenome]